MPPFSVSKNLSVVFFVEQRSSRRRPGRRTNKHNNAFHTLPVHVDSPKFRSVCVVIDSRACDRVDRQIPAWRDLAGPVVPVFRGGSEYSETRYGFMTKHSSIGSARACGGGAGFERSHRPVAVCRGRRFARNARMLKTDKEHNRFGGCLCEGRGSIVANLIAPRRKTSIRVRRHIATLSRAFESLARPDCSRRKRWL
ncbi:hypothetical protein P171DRAFT_447676 [Karstenula rhodostoma CBS 690.94]|uniref:Uncharacterized protein n=1 Tax=Karstenula rhodostoma CBS 690.94 TaxID=1392251 RepID=A0A9P4PBH6_9PLEO|nr:hypothetical protein P171DRAFT_447676 [Karstenula rhodostoma CBS 690.94]